MTADRDRPSLTDIDIVCVDDRAFGGGTFQSHNQKVVSNRNGIFMTYLRRRYNETSVVQEWRLLHSTDGGRTFSALYEATDEIAPLKFPPKSRPPALETDAQDNLYLARPDFVDCNVYLYRFLAADGYARPHISKIENGATGKYCMMYDRRRGQLYYFAQNGFHTIGLKGEVRSSRKLLQAGQTAGPQYSQLSLDRDGVLHAAWTGVKHGTYLYTDIHTVQSKDGGETWRKMDGAPLALPVVCDEHGPTDRITLDDEYEFDTWLSSFMVKDGKLHFIYKYRAPGESARQHYVRYDLKTARKDRDVWPEFKGERVSLSHFDGFFASQASLPDSPLYCTMAQDGRIACLASDDNGDIWHDYAVSEKRFATSEKLSNPYAIGGCRELTADGWIIGSFTDRIPDPAQVSDLTVSGATAPVYFFKILAGLVGK